MYKKLFLFLNQMILDLSTRAFFLSFSIWKNERACQLNKGRERSARIASGVQFCLGHKAWFSYVGKVPEDRGFFFLPTVSEFADISDNR